MSSGWRDRLGRDPHAQAALVYAAYGFVYLAGALRGLTPERRVTFFGFVPWWAFFVLGGLLVLAIPWLIATQGHRRRWVGKLELVLSLLVAVKALTLCWRQGRHVQAGEVAPAFNWLFIAVAVAASVALFRASRAGPEPPGDAS